MTFTSSYNFRSYFTTVLAKVLSEQILTLILIFAIFLYVHLSVHIIAAQLNAEDSFKITFSLIVIDALLVLSLIRLILPLVFTLYYYHRNHIFLNSKSMYVINDSYISIQNTFREFKIFWSAIKQKRALFNRYFFTDYTHMTYAFPIYQLSHEQIVETEKIISKNFKKKIQNI